MKKFYCIVILLIIIIVLVSCANNMALESNEIVNIGEFDTLANFEEKKDYYFLEDGTFVRTDVIIDSDTKITNKEYVKFNVVKDPLFYLTTVFSRGYNDTTIAIVKKIGSTSYYMSDEKKNVLAYTLSEVEVLGLPSDNNGLNVGDVVNVLECYAFAPDDPDVIYYYPTFLNSHSNVVLGIMESNKEYLVLLWDSAEDSGLRFARRYYGNDELNLNYVVLPDGFKYITSIYPVYEGAFEAVINGSIKDLCLPSKDGMEEFNDMYLAAYDQFIKKNTGEE